MSFGINMSYCRQENTYLALREALSDVEEHMNEEAEYEISDREIQNFRNMVEYFHDFLCNQELLDEDGNLDDEALDRVCEAMAKSYDEEDEEEDY